MVVAPPGVFRVGVLDSSRLDTTMLNWESRGVSCHKMVVRFGTRERMEDKSSARSSSLTNMTLSGEISAKASKPCSGPRISKAMTNASELFATASVFIPLLMVATQLEKQVIGLAVGVFLSDTSDDIPRLEILALALQHQSDESVIREVGG